MFPAPLVSRSSCIDSLANNSAAMNDRHLVRQRLCFVKIMSSKQNRTALRPQFGDSIRAPAAKRLVETTRRLIEQHNFRLVNQSSGSATFCLLPFERLPPGALRLCPSSNRASKPIDPFGPLSGRIS